MAKIEELSSEESGGEMTGKASGKDDVGAVGDIDFTKRTPDDYMPEDIDHVFKSLRKRGKRTKGNEEEEDHGDSSYDNEDEEENPDFFDDTRNKSSDENATKKKFIAFLMISPMLISGFLMMSDTFKRFYNFDNTVMQITAAVGGAAIALYATVKIPQLREAVKFVMYFAWIIFLLPTYQVYNCSPIELKNTMIGTWFKLKTEPHRFLESSYVTSECFKAYYLKAPYSLSMISAKIRLVVQIDDLINLDGSNVQSKEGKSSTQETPSYFLAVSKRSVKKKFHKLYVIFEAQGQNADLLMKSLKLSPSEKDKHLLVITGSVEPLEDELLPTKRELEKLNYFVRPIKFKVLTTSYRDKYVKLRHEADESMY